jgi:hypothetical protein
VGCSAAREGGGEAGEGVGKERRGCRKETYAAGVCATAGRFAGSREAKKRRKIVANK